MNKVSANLSGMRLGLALSLLTLLYGFCLGGAFGAFEDPIKDHLEASAANVLNSTYDNQPEKTEKVLKKSWSYFKRAHLHANGLGSASLIIILLLSLVSGQRFARFLVALALGIGSFGYSVFWMFAGLRTPVLGSTGAAKESLRWLAIPSAGLCILGLLAAAVLLVIKLFPRRSSTS